MPKIMLVEDDNNLREIYGERLMAEGYDIVSANDGEEALALAVKEKPDLILSDVMMPKISGFDMLDILRQTPETKNTKVVMMTALSQTEDKDRAERLGADRYLVKSQVTLEDVARVVHDLLYGESEPAMQSSVEDTDDAATSEPTSTNLPPEPVSQESPTKIEPETPVIEDASSNPSVAVDDDTADEDSSQPVVGTQNPPMPDPAATVQTQEEAAVQTEVAQPTTNEEQPSSYSNLFDENKIDSFNASTTDNTAETINPITGAPAAQEITQTNGVGSANAPTTYEETTEINHEIEQFTNNENEEPKHSEPLIEPTEQDIIHAKNSAEDPEVTKPEVAQKVEPVVDASESTDDSATHKKVIKPITDGSVEYSPDINALYEQEMRKEAAGTTVDNPELGAVLDPDKDNTNNPISDSLNTIPPAQYVDASQIQGMTTNNNNEPSNANSEQNNVDPSDPSHIAL